MQGDRTLEAKTTLQSALKELEATKGSVTAGIQLLKRAATMLKEVDVSIWCEVQLGNEKYTKPLYKIQTLMLTEDGAFNNGSELSPALMDAIIGLEALGLEPRDYAEDLSKKFNNSGGGYDGIDSIEAKYTDFVRLKKGNDGTYYKNNLQSHIAYVKRVAHDKATSLYNKIAFANAPQTTFDLLKAEIDDKLLDLNPELAEKLMLAFRSVAGDNPEEWSQALTSCRRFIEGLADLLFPASDKVVNEKSLGKTQYINRLWAFMDQSIESDSNKDLAKAHVDLLGAYLQRTHKLSNKGVHAELTKVEAVKTVFHVYLMVADILGYLAYKPSGTGKKLDLNTISLDELESVLGISRQVAKEVVKLRVEKGPLSLQDLRSIGGIGEKTMSKASTIF